MTAAAVVGLLTWTSSSGASESGGGGGAFLEGLRSLRRGGNTPPLSSDHSVSVGPYISLGCTVAHPASAT